MWQQMKFWRSWKRREAREADLERELRNHLDLEAEEQREARVSPEEAAYAARRALGNTVRIKEDVRVAWGFQWLETLFQDVRYGLRQLRRYPGFAATAILVLALAIGVSAAIFGFVDAALLEPLPYANPVRLMSVNESSVKSPRWPLSYPDYLDWQRMNKSFSSLDIYSGAGYLLHTRSGAEPVQGAHVSGGFFQTLGVHPVLGRDFYPGEDRPGGPNVVLLSYGAWVHRFGRERDAVGQTVDLDDRAYTIIGVLPPAFSFAPSGNAELWVPVAGGRICRDGAGLGSRWPVWSDLLLSEPAHAGDRCARGSRSTARLGVQARDAAGGMADAGRASDRVGLFRGNIPVGPRPVVRSAGMGRGDSWLRGRVAWAGVDRGQLPARASRSKRRSHGGAAL
jgi:hypothetical protein